MNTVLIEQSVFSQSTTLPNSTLLNKSELSEWGQMYYNKTPLKFKQTFLQYYRDGNLSYDDILNLNLEDRNNIYIEVSQYIIHNVVSNLQNLNNITHVITTSCTGIYAPGIEHYICKQFNLQNCATIPLNYVGCSAGTKSIILANDIIHNQPKAKILIVNFEFCSIHVENPDTKEHIINNSLFGDGCSASIFAHKSAVDDYSLEITETQVLTVPHHSDALTWKMTNNNFSMYIDKELPNILSKHIHFKYDVSDYEWIVHPGGPSVLDKVQKMMNIQNMDDSSHHILHNYGNMSSATVFYILNRILAKQKECNKYVMISFGPGLTIDMCLFTTKSSV